jgi:hypothetical protein
MSNLTNSTYAKPASTNSFDIARDCSLISISGSLYPWAKKDEVAATNAAVADHATSSRYTAYVQRLTKEDRLAPQQILSEARRYLDFPTGFKWDGKGNFAVQNVKLDGVVSKLEEYKAKFYDAVDQLCKRLPELAAKAKADLNGSFDRLGFPSEDEVRERYTFDIKQGVIPAAEDIRLNHVSSKARAAIETAIRKEQTDKVTELHQQVVEALEKSLARVVSNLSEFTEGKIARFEDTLVTNLEELVEALPSLNVSGDRAVDAAIIRSRNLVAGLHKAQMENTLRDKKSEAGPAVRKEIAKEAGDILSKLKSGAVKASINTAPVEA